MPDANVALWQFVLVLAVQFGGVVWWASGLNRRVNTIEETQVSRTAMIERFLKSEGKVELLEHQAATFREDINRRLDRIERKIDQINDRKPQLLED